MTTVFPLSFFTVCRPAYSREKRVFTGTGTKPSPQESARRKAGSEEQEKEEQQPGRARGEPPGCCCALRGHGTPELKLAQGRMQGGAVCLLAKAKPQAAGARRGAPAAMGMTAVCRASAETGGHFQYDTEQQQRVWEHLGHTGWENGLEQDEPAEEEGSSPLDRRGRSGTTRDCGAGCETAHGTAPKRSIRPLGPGVKYHPLAP